MAAGTRLRLQTGYRPAAVLSSLLLVLTAVFSSVSLPLPAAGAELLMFEEKGCPWCLRWRQDVGPAYPRSPEGKRAPLRVIGIHTKLRPAIALAGPVRVSPTFVLVESGREVGRITGYPGPDFFWALLGELIAKLPRADESGVHAAQSRVGDPSRLPARSDTAGSTTE
ncbi:MAG: thioredoxin family protein [Hyphomicrobiaceae bacterium]